MPAPELALNGERTPASGFVGVDYEDIAAVRSGAEFGLRWPAGTREALGLEAEAVLSQLRWYGYWNLAPFGDGSNLSGFCAPGVLARWDDVNNFDAALLSRLPGVLPDGSLHVLGRMPLELYPPDVASGPYFDEDDDNTFADRVEVRARVRAGDVAGRVELNGVHFPAASTEMELP
jgi:hypothetical protein